MYFDNITINHLHFIYTKYVLHILHEIMHRVNRKNFS